MTTTERPPGKTTIAPGVLVTIVKLAALQVEGVSRLAPGPSGVNNLFSRGRDEGVIIEVNEQGEVTADVHLVLTDRINVREVSRNIQEEVALAIRKLVGMEVKAVNIHIDDIDFQFDQPAEG
jgi:uncharacterized alkaline shock family protein YloU